MLIQVGMESCEHSILVEAVALLEVGFSIKCLAV